MKDTYISISRKKQHRPEEGLRHKKTKWVQQCIKPDNIYFDDTRKNIVRKTPLYESIKNLFIVLILTTWCLCYIQIEALFNRMTKGLIDIIKVRVVIPYLQK